MTFFIRVRDVKRSRLTSTLQEPAPPKTTTPVTEDDDDDVYANVKYAFARLLSVRQNDSYAIFNALVVAHVSVRLRGFGGIGIGIGIGGGRDLVFGICEYSTILRGAR